MAATPEADERSHQVAPAAPPYRGRKFSQFKLGDRFGSVVVVSPEHLTVGAALIRDFNPLHVDPEFAARSRFGGCILHGAMTSALMSASFGNLVAGTAIGYLEHNARFFAPVAAGDTLEIEWSVIELLPKPAKGGGIVVADCEARNQRGELVATAVGKLLVGDGAD